MRRLLLLLIVLDGCADLRSLEPNVCGNGVRDAGEECDAWADPALGSGTRCAPPEDPARACRYECATASCPVGWGCGGDGICRRASGEFDLVSQVDMLSASFALADVDGDETPDAVGSSSGTIAIRFGDGRGGWDGDLLREAPIHGAGPPALGDLDGDGRADLVSPTPAGLVVLRGAHERRLDPAAYAPYELLSAEAAWMIPVDADGLGPGQGLLYLSDVGPRTEQYLVPVPYPGEDAIAPWSVSETPFDVLALPPRLAVANLDADAASEIVLAPAGSQAVVILETRQTNGFLLPTGVLTGVVDDQGFTLPEAVDPDVSPIALDLDGDGAVEVLVSAGGRAFVRRNGVVAVEPRFDPLSSFPLAAGDIDGDGLADFVTRDAIYRATGPAPDDELEPIYQDVANPWSEAVIGHFAGVAFADVAVARDASIELLVAQAGGFTSLSEPTTRPPRMLRSGNFDGDGLDDVLLVERHDDGDELTILFGAASGSPERVRVGRLPWLDHVEIGRLQLTHQLPFDAADDIVATPLPDDDGRRSLAVILGSGNRTLFSPYVLQRNNVSAPPLGVLAGRFLGGDPGEAEDVVAITQTQNGQMSLWLLPGTYRTGFGPDFAKPYDLITDPLDPRCALFERGDLVGDGREVIVIVTPLASPDCDEDPPALRIASAPSGALQHVRKALPEAGSAAVDVAIGDADGDGAPDLAILWREALVVYWGPDHDTATRLPVTARSLAFVQADGDAALELAALTSDALVIVDAVERALAPRAAMDMAAPATRVRVADLDGDGLGDLVIGDGATVSVYASRPGGAP